MSAVGPRTDLALSESRHGPMLYLKGDRVVGASLAQYGEYSEREFDLLRQLVRPGDMVAEVGANIGAHTVPLARLVGREGAVFAFEPQRIIFQILCANLVLNGLRNVLAHPVGLGRETGVLRVPPVDYGAPGDFGGIALVDGPGEPVQVMTLDQYGLQRLRLLKIDAEGMEEQVLQGARGTIARLRPLLYVENDRADTSAALIRTVRGLGYRLWWHLPPLFSPENHFGKAENVFGPLVSVNMLAVPQEAEAQIDLPEITADDADWRDALR